MRKTDKYLAIMIAASMVSTTSWMSGTATVLANTRLNTTENIESQNIVNNTPKIKVPESMEAKVGQLLKEIELENGWKWKNLEQSIIEGENNYSIYIEAVDGYDYSNIEGYNSEENIVERSITVNGISEENITNENQITLGGFTIKGGVDKNDFSYNSGVLTILSSTPITISTNTQTSDRIIVPADVTANITFAGVDINTSANAPFTLTPKVDGGATANITLAKDTTNTFVSTNASYSGIRAGETTILNISGEGKLIAKSGTNAAGIGGSAGESGGDITIDSGEIESICPYPTSSSNGSGAGIGGGRKGNGGNITINGGNIKATGGYHGAGIGGGWDSSITASLSPAPATSISGHKFFSGNITITGGYIESNGSGHGDAFGDGCYGEAGADATTSERFTIKMTGGTVIANAPESGGLSTNDLGGRGARVIVTGGSLKASKFKSLNKAGKLESVAYGDEDMTTQVFMTTIDVQSAAGSGMDAKFAKIADDFLMKVNGVTKSYGKPECTDKEGKLYLWLPKGDNPNESFEVSVDLTATSTSGTKIETDTFFAEDVKPGEENKLKQYISFEIKDESINGVLTSLNGKYTGPKDLTDLINAIARLGIEVTIPPGEKLTDAGSIKIQSQKMIVDDDGNYIPDPDAPIVDGIGRAGVNRIIITSTQYAKETTFADAYWGHRTYYDGAYVTIDKVDSEIKITDITSEDGTDLVEDENGNFATQAEDTINITVNVSPAAENADSCEKPTGEVQFYINGKPIGNPVKIENGEAVLKWNPLEDKDLYEYVKDGKYTITAEYKGDYNYNSSKTESSSVEDNEYGKVTIDVDTIDIPNVDNIVDSEDTNNIYIPSNRIDVNKDTDNDGKPEVNIDTDGDFLPNINLDLDGDGKPNLNIDTDGDGLADINIDTDGDGLPELNIDTDGTGDWHATKDKSHETDGIWMPDRNIDTDGDGVADKNVIPEGGGEYKPDFDREPVDGNDDGVDDYWNPDKDITINKGQNNEVSYGTGDIGNIPSGGGGGFDYSHETIIGDNRFETGAMVAEKVGNYKTIILVNASRTLADGLSASSLAGKESATIIPIKYDSIPDCSKDIIAKADAVYLIGETEAISQKVEDSLTNNKVIRIGGEDRFETSEEVAKYIGSYDEAFIVNGLIGEADAMSVSSVAARDISPIILSNGSKINYDKENGVSYTVIGGTSVIPDSMQKKFDAERIGGATRYDTNRMVIKEYYDGGSTRYFCNGDTLIDALTASYLARNDGIVLVSAKDNHDLLYAVDTIQVGGLPFEVSFNKKK